MPKTYLTTAYLTDKFEVIYSKKKKKMKTQPLHEKKIYDLSCWEQCLIWFNSWEKNHFISKFTSLKKKNCKQFRHIFFKIFCYSFKIFLILAQNFFQLPLLPKLSEGSLILFKVTKYMQQDCRCSSKSDHFIHVRLCTTFQDYK